jgi:hypothetical protein
MDSKKTEKKRKKEKPFSTGKLLGTLAREAASSMTKSRKPQPSDLGAGLAAGAARALVNHKKQLNKY